MSQNVWSHQVAAAEQAVYAAPLVYVNVPGSLAELKSEAGITVKALSAGEWSLAAWVWAFVQPGVVGNGGQAIRENPNGKLTCNGLAQEGMKGLKDNGVVLAYWKMWQWAIEHGHALPSVKGEEVSLPALDWKECKEKALKGAASSDIPPAPAAVKLFSFSLSDSSLEDQDLASAELLVQKLQALIAEKKALMDLHVDGQLEPGKKVGLADLGCGVCGQSAEMISYVSSSPSGWVGYWPSLQVGHVDGCGMAQPHLEFAGMEKGLVKNTLLVQKAAEMLAGKK